MKVEQVAVFLENKSGRIAEITKVLADSDINIRALTVADTADFGILRLIVNQVDKARETLKENGYTVGKTEVVAVEVEDRPGGLAEVMAVIHAASLNVEYMYASLGKSGGNVVIIFRFENLDAAIDILQKAGIKILSNQEVCSI